MMDTEKQQKTLNRLMLKTGTLEKILYRESGNVVVSEMVNGELYITTIFPNGTTERRKY